MRKKIFSAAFVVAMAAIAGYSTFQVQNESKLAGIALSNAEALASGEVIFGPWYCIGDVNICLQDDQGTIFGQKFYF